MIHAHAVAERNINIVMARESKMLNIVEYKNNIEEILKGIEEVRGSL